MSHVAIVTDSASDLPPDVAAAQAITVVPLVVSFGAESFRPNVDLTTDAFWERMTAPDAPFPTTAAAVARRLQDRVRGRVRRRRRRRRVRQRVGRPVGDAQVRPGRARACSRTARSTSSTRGRRRWASGSWPRSARSSRAEGVVGGRDRPRPRGAQGRRRPVRRPRHARVPQARRPDQRRARRGRHDAVDQADHHGPRTGSSRTRTGSGPARRRASGSSSC